MLDNEAHFDFLYDQWQLKGRLTKDISKKIKAIMANPGQSRYGYLNNYSQNNG